MLWIIILIIVILFFVLLGWTWHNLGNINKTTKCNCIVGGLVVVYIITFIIYNISKIGITYENKDTMKIIQTVFVVIFTIINGYIILPYAFKKIEQIYNDEIEKNTLIKSIIILVVIIFMIGIFECSYLGSVQKGILNMITK